MDKKKRNKYINEILPILDNDFEYFVFNYGLYNYMSLEDMEDMKSECLVAIIETIEKFDVKRGVKLTTYIRPRINGFFKDYLRKNSSNRHKEIAFFTNQKNTIDELNYCNEYKKKLVLNNENTAIDLKVIVNKPFDYCLLVFIFGLPDKQLYLIIEHYFYNKSIKELTEELELNYDAGWLYQIRRKALSNLKNVLDNRKKKGDQNE